MESYIWAFIVGGLICVIGQPLLDVGKLYTGTHSDYFGGGWCYFIRI